MRKVTQDIARAFINGQKKTVSNTHTDGMSVWLHGNEIMRKTGSKEFRVSLCGWGTPTTRERLNGILCFAGVNANFFQQNHEQFLCVNGQTVHIDSNDIISVNPNGHINWTGNIAK